MVMKVLRDGVWSDISTTSPPTKLVMDTSAGTSTTQPGTLYMITDDNIRNLHIKVEVGGSLNEFFKDTKSLFTFDFKNVELQPSTDMSRMFEGSYINLVEGSDIEVVGSRMYSMFHSSRIQMIKNFTFKSGVQFGININTGWLHSTSSNLKLENIDVSNLDSLAYMFNRSFKSELHPGELVGTENVLDTSHMFSFSRITKIHPGALITTNVNNMNEMFRDSLIREIDGNLFSFSNARRLYNMFQASQIRLIKNVTFKNGVQFGININSGWLHSTPSDLRLKNVDVSKLDSLAYMFNRSFKSELHPGELVGTQSVSDTSHMFSYSRVTKIHPNALITSNVNNMSEMFRNSLIREIDGNQISFSNASRLYSMFQASQIRLIKNVTFKNGAQFGNSINSGWLNSTRSDLRLVNVDVSNLDSLAYMFSRASITSVDDTYINNADGVFDISNMFAYARTTSVDIGIPSVNNIYRTFYFATPLRSLKLNGMGSTFQQNALRRTIDVSRTALDATAMNELAHSLAVTNPVTPWIIKYKSNVNWDTSIATNKGYVVTT